MHLGLGSNVNDKVVKDENNNITHAIGGDQRNLVESIFRLNRTRVSRRNVRIGVARNGEPYVNPFVHHRT